MGLNPILDEGELFDHNIIEFLKFLNQEVTFNNYSNLLVIKDKFTFDNVWSRRKAYIHSSFSDSNRGYIGLRNDFWQQPSKIYTYCNHGTEFWIRFTTNGVNGFLPIHCGLIVELVFVCDYDNIEFLN
jgi:hypothetical protein